MRLLRRAVFFPILAIPILTVPLLADTSTFVFNGTPNSTGQNADVSAIFDVTGGKLFVTLNNTTSNLTYDNQVLTGVYFAFAGAGSTAGTVTNPTVQGYDIRDWNGQLSQKGSPFATNWRTLVDLSGFVTLTNLDNHNWAGSKGIISTSTNPDGTNNLARHEAYIVGPVQFAISGLNVTSASQITGVEFNFGTSLGTKTGLVSPQSLTTSISPTPEPATLGIAATALLGLLALGWMKRRNPVLPVSRNPA